MNTNDASGDEEVCAAFGVGSRDTNGAMQRVNAMATETDTAARDVNEFDYLGRTVNTFDAGLSHAHGDAGAAAALSLPLGGLGMRGMCELLEFRNQERVGGDLGCWSIEGAFAR